MPTERTHDYPPKNRVREAGMRFLPPSFPDPTTVWGIYLPGPANMELEGFLRKGINPKHLIGAEHNPDTRVHRADEIVFVRGSVFEAVQLMRERGFSPITFANLDFDGSHHTNIRDVLSVFSLFPADTFAYLIVTSFCSRDDEALLQGVVNSSKFYSVFDSTAAFWTAYGRMVDRYKAIQRQFVDSRVDNHTHLSRELGFLWWIAFVIGTVENRRGSLWTVNEPYMDTCDDVLKDITDRALDRIGVAGEFRIYNDPRLGDRLRARDCFLWPDRFEHYVWYTAQHKPMRTWMLRFQPTSEEPRPTHFEVVEQLWNMATKSPLVYFDERGTQIIID